MTLFMHLLRFLGEWLVLAVLIAIVKTGYERVYHEAGGSAAFLYREMFTKNFLVDGLMIGFVVGVALDLLRQLISVRQDIKTLNNNAAIEAGKEIAKKVQGHLTSIDEKYTSISDIIRTALRESHIYVAGVRKADSDIVHWLGTSAHRFKDSPDGVLILRVSGITEYSETCVELLKMAEKSVWSMSDMGLDQTFMLYCISPTGLSEWDGDGNRVRAWVTAVNSSVIRQLDVKRIQIVNSDRMILVERLKAYNDAKVSRGTVNPDDVLSVIRPSLRYGITSLSSRVDVLLEGWKKYVELYAQGQGIDWFVYDESDSSQNKQREREGCAIGEFIIIDEKYLVRYSSQTGILELLMGNVVEIFASQFKKQQFLDQLTIANNETARKLATL